MPTGGEGYKSKDKSEFIIGPSQVQLNSFNSISISLMLIFSLNWFQIRMSFFFPYKQAFNVSSATRTRLIVIFRASIPELVLRLRDKHPDVVITLSK